MNAMPGWLIESGWQAAVMVLIISLVLLAACGRIPPKWRYALWLLVVLRLLLPALPEAQVSAYRVVPASPGQAWEAALPSQPAPEWLEPRAEPSFVPPQRQGVDWRMVLGWLWLGGVASYGGWLIFRQAAFSWHYRRTRQRPSPEMEEILALGARRAGLRRAPELWVLPGINGAALSGLIRPVIVAPPELEKTLDRQRLELVLLHECVHLRRGDMWTHAAAVLAGVMHWWNPVVCWLRGRLRAERELATDAAVLECLEQPEQLLYGETLLELATQPSAGLSTLQPSLGLLERHGDLRQRMVQISSFSRATMVWSMAGVVLLVGLAVVLLVRQTEAPLEPLPTGERESFAVNQDFYEAVRKGDMRKVKEYLRRGYQINNTEGTNALFGAIHVRNLPMVRFLIAHGVPLNETTASGDTAINHACWVGDKAILDTMITAGAKCDPYSYAISTGDIAALDKKQAEKPLTKDELMVGMCMATAANAASNDWFWAHLSPLLTPEEKANWLGERFVNTAFWGRLDMMQDVEKMGVDFPKYGPSALNSAISHGHLPMIKYLLGRGVILSEPKPNSAGPLRNAAGEGQVEVVKFLLDHGADINARDGQGLTPLAWAISNRRVEVCRLLLDRGADVSLKNEWGQTALWSAASGGMQPEMVELLLRHGADPRGVDKNGAPILTAMQGVYFPRKGKVGYPGKIYTDEEIKEWQVSVRKTVELLIQAGADPNASGGFAGTPLIAAVSNGQYAIAKALIDHGADIHQRDKKGNAPIAFFFRGGQGGGVDSALLQLLLDRGADPNSTLMEPHSSSAQPMTLIDSAIYMASLQQDDPELLAQTRRSVEMLLQHGMKISVPGDVRGSEWITAAALGDVARMKQLRAAGVDVNTKLPSSYGRSWNALSVAMALGRNEAADWLMGQAGIDLAFSGQARSPLFLAIQRQDMALVRKLLAAGVKPDSGEMTMAARTGNTKLFILLQQGGGDASQVRLRSVIEQSNLDILKLALDSGAAAHQTSNVKINGVPENTDPVYCAVEQNKPEALKLLLQYNLPLNLKDAKGETPLSLAQKWHYSAIAAMLEEAIKRSAPDPTPTP